MSAVTEIMPTVAQSYGQATAAVTVQEEKPSCGICYDEFNKSTRKEVVCPYGSHSFCRGCVEKYVLSQGEQIACPDTECRMPWTEEFVDEQFTAVFRKGALRAHREKFVLDHQKARLPELQERARRYKIAIDIIDGKKKAYEELSDKYYEVPEVVEYERLNAIAKNLKTQYSALTYSLYKVANTSKYDPTTKRYINTPKPGKEEEYAVLDAKATAAGAEHRAAAEIANVYYAENEKVIEAAKKKYLKKARSENRAPEVRDMIESYGAPIRIWGNTDSAKYKKAIEIFGEGAATAGRGAGDAATERRHVEVMRGCPEEGCRGFLDGKWKCGVCDARVCRHCHDVLEEDEAAPARMMHAGSGSASGQSGSSSSSQEPAEEAPPKDKRWHVCEIAAVETARMLAKDTKPCPSCKALISKIDGCDQMWCTLCQTPFSWATGQKEEGRVHNPHYYEWLRRTKGSVPREMGDVPGGDCCAADNTLRPLLWMHHTDVVNGAYDLLFTDVTGAVTKRIDELGHVEDVRLEMMGYVAGKASQIISEFHRRILEVYQYDVANRQTWYERYTDRQGEEDAIDYLVGRLSEGDWQKKCWSRDRLRRFRNDVKEIKRMFYAAGRDLLNSLTIGMGSVKVGETIKGLVELTNYSNEMIMNARKRYCLTAYYNDMLINMNIANQLFFPNIEEGDKYNRNFVTKMGGVWQVSGTKLLQEEQITRMANVNTMMKLMFGFCGSEVPKKYI
jgi:hypothetical protein